MESNDKNHQKCEGNHPTSYGCEEVKLDVSFFLVRFGDFVYFIEEVSHQTTADDKSNLNKRARNCACSKLPQLSHSVIALDNRCSWVGVEMALWRRTSGNFSQSTPGPLRQGWVRAGGGLHKNNLNTFSARFIIHQWIMYSWKESFWQHKNNDELEFQLLHFNEAFHFFFKISSK